MGGCSARKIAPPRRLELTMDEKNIAVAEAEDIMNNEVTEEQAADTIEEVLEANASDTPKPVDPELAEIERKHKKKKKIAAFFDKITTGIFIFLMASPILILGYIFLWFYLLVVQGQGI